jgi:hypothetical protein
MLLVGLLVFANCITPMYAQQNTAIATDTVDFAQIAFNEKSFDFGQVKAGDKLEHTFVFENKGKTPLVIKQVLTTCGCTAIKWSKTPIPPNEKGEITVKFDTKGKEGEHIKPITVVSNAYTPTAKLFIRTEILRENQ